MTTHLEGLLRGLAIVEAEPGGKDSQFARDLKGQIAAAKEAKQGSAMHEARFFGHAVSSKTPSSATEPTKHPMAPAVDQMEIALKEMGERAVARLEGSSSEPDAK